MKVNLPEGLKVFPVKNEIKDGRKNYQWMADIHDATDDPEQIQAWLDKGYLLGAPVGSEWGLVAIDIDPDEVNASMDDAVFQKQFGYLPETWTCKTPRGGGHPVYLISGTYGSLHNFKITDGFDVKVSNNNYIVVGGGGYIADTTVSTIVHAPDWLMQMAIEKSARPISKLDENKKYTPEQEVEFAENCLARISRLRADDYEEWIKVGMALSTMRDKNRALKLFHEFSRQSYKYNEAECEEKFEGFKRDGGVTLGTLYYMAEQDSPSNKRIGKREADELDDVIEKTKSEIKEAGELSLDDELTALGNSKRLIALHGNEMRWCEDEKIWYVWNGQRWEADKANKVLEFCEDVVKKLLTEAVETKSDDERRRMTKHALASQTGNSFKDMLYLARTHSVSPDEFDPDPELLNCNNGVVNLRTGELLGHDPKYMMRKLVPYDYAKVDCPKWKAFLKYALEDDELLHYYQKAMGLSASGRVDKFLGWMYGVPNSGKSTISETLLAIMGDYGEKTNIVAFSKSVFDEGGDKPNSYVTALKGKRFVVANETRRDGRLDVALLKDLSGMDTLTSRRQYGVKETFPASHTLWIYGNHEPDLREDADDDAFFVRLGEIPFKKELPKQENGAFRLFDEVKAEYLAEASGILHWMVQGYQAWLKEGLVKPATVENAIKEFQNSQDTLLLFIEEEHEKGDEFKVRKADFVEEYNDYLKKCGSKPVTPAYIGRRMKGLGYSIGGNGKAFFLGLQKRNTKMIGMHKSPPKQGTEEL